MIVTKNCLDCGVQFQYDEKPGYPRKYCPGCSEKRKASFKAKKEQNVQPAPSNAVLGVTEGIGEVKHIFQNSYEVGKAGNRFTIRYWDTEDLKKQIAELQKAQLWDEGIETVKV